MIHLGKHTMHYEAENHNLWTDVSLSQFPQNIQMLRNCSSSSKKCLKLKHSIFASDIWNTKALLVWWCGVPECIFFSEILGLLQVELLVWMVCDRFICNFAITGVRMNVGIDQPSTRSLNTGMLFCAALIFIVVVWDAEPKEVLQIPFSFQGDHWSVWGRVRYKIFTKTSYFQFVGSCGLLW